MRNVPRSSCQQGARFSTFFSVVFLGLVAIAGCATSKPSDKEATPSATPAEEVQHTASYEIDLGLVSDFEELRPLIVQCVDLGELEGIREKLESTTNLEEFRDILEPLGIVNMNGCPGDVRGPGITLLK
jgi:hypothetical protein